MARIDSLHNRVDSLLARVKQAETPRLIVCHGARDELLSRLAGQVALRPASSQEEIPFSPDELRATLARLIIDTEATYNVSVESHIVVPI